METDTLTQVTGAEPEPQDGENQPVVAEAEATVTPGESTEVTEATAPEAKAPEPAPEKTYTEAQLRQIQAQYDRREAQQQQAIAQVALRQQAMEMQRWEAEQQARDKSDMDAGNITQDEAAQRSHARQYTLQTIQRAQQVQQKLAAMEQRGSLLGRILMAHDIAKQYGVSPEDLLGDKSIVDEGTLYAAVARLVKKAADETKRQAQIKPEKFDRGPGPGTTGISNDDQFMTLYAEGKSSDHARARKIMAKQGINI